LINNIVFNYGENIIYSKIRENITKNRKNTKSLDGFFISLIFIPNTKKLVSIILNKIIYKKIIHKNYTFLIP